MRTNYEIYRLKRRWVQLRSWRLFIASLEGDSRRRGSAQSAWSWVRQSILPCLTYTTLLAKGENYYSYIIMNINALKHVTFSAQEILKHKVLESMYQWILYTCTCIQMWLQKYWSKSESIFCGHNCKLQLWCTGTSFHLVPAAMHVCTCHSACYQLRCTIMSFHLVPAAMHMHVIPLNTSCDPYAICTCHST